MPRELTVDKTGTKISGVTSSSDVTGLTNGTQYAFAVSAVNAGGESALSTVQTATPPLVVGQNYQGGIIAYIDGTGKHGLIAPVNDVSPGTFYAYGCWGVLVGAGGSAYGTGVTNTQAIHNNCSNSEAGALCYNLSLNGYDDWVLPSKDELAIYLWPIFYTHLSIFGECERISPYFLPRSRNVVDMIFAKGTHFTC